MKVTPTNIPDVLIIEPDVFADVRGTFSEIYQRDKLNAAIGREVTFVQDNCSTSHQHVVRGLHYQILQAQTKLVQVLEGEVFDVAVDMRRASPTFGQWIGTILSATNRRQLWIPEGFAHGFMVLSPSATTLYKASDYYAPQHECSVLWNDADIGIQWPVITHNVVISDKDKQASAFKNAETF